MKGTIDITAGTKGLIRGRVITSTKGRVKLTEMSMIAHRVRNMGSRKNTTPMKGGTNKQLVGKFNTLLFSYQFRHSIINSVNMIRDSEVPSETHKEIDNENFGYNRKRTTSHRSHQLGFDRVFQLQSGFCNLWGSWRHKPCYLFICRLIRSVRNRLLHVRLKGNTASLVRYTCHS